MDRAPSAPERPRLGLTRSRVGLIASLVVGIIGSTQGCFCDGCDPEPVAPIPVPKVCELDKNCGDRDAYRFGECRLSGCENDDECCPGTRCRLAVNACVPHQLDPEYQCETDADCPDPAQRCLDTKLGERDPIPVCAFERCSGDADCGTGRSCFLTGGSGEQGVCVETAPCGGGCPSGEVCDPLTSQCAPLPTSDGIVNVGCNQDCGEAGLLVVANPDEMTGEVCCELICRCRGLPPLLSTRFGKYADIAVGNEELLVSAYDSQYGDLVLAHYKMDGAYSHIDYVDGTPLTGAVVADPNGPRNGIAEPGPDVGTHTSLALDPQGKARIAYHDVENRSLKIALQTEGGGWTSYVLDSPAEEGGYVGEYTDVAVDAQTGTIFISYLAREVSGAPQISGLASGAKLARSTTPTPSGPADWDIFWVDARRTFDPCDGACGASQQCVLDGGAPVCASETTGCTDCSSTQFCVAGAGATGGPGCLVTAIPPTITDFPKVRGMYTSVALLDGQAYLAYYDSIDGDLRTGHVNTGGGTSSSVLDGDGATGRRGGDVGRFPAIINVASELLVVYEDFTRHEVRAWQGADPAAAGTFAVVDSGKVAGEPGKKFVGAGARVALDDDGNPVIVYQDASHLDLKLARRDASGWTPESILSEGAHGFYAGVATRDGSAFLVSVLAELDGRGRERARAAVTVHALP